MNINELIKMNNEDLIKTRSKLFSSESNRSRPKVVSQEQTLDHSVELHFHSHSCEVLLQKSRPSSPTTFCRPQSPLNYNGSLNNSRCNNDEINWTNDWTKKSGRPSTANSSFGKEERFKSLTNAVRNNSSYSASPESLIVLPKINDTKSVVFPEADRFSYQKNRLDTSVNGPGSYDVRKGLALFSEYRGVHANKFSNSNRQPLDLKTDSPGAVYKIDKQFYNGNDKKIRIGFNLDPKFGKTKIATPGDEIITPLKRPMSASMAVNGVSMGVRHPRQELKSEAPGPIYDVHEKVTFKTTSGFSFGKGTNDRFKPVSFFPEIIQ